MWHPRVGESPARYENVTPAGTGELRRVFCHRGACKWGGALMVAKTSRLQVGRSPDGCENVTPASGEEP
eukprot:1191344-Prorocentrum_minimum.AAC.4